MGSAEGTMSVFAKRLKNGRSWSDEGLDKFFDVMVAFKDNLEIKTLQGVLEQTQELTQENKEAKPPKHFVEKDRKSTRLNSSHVANSYAVFCLIKNNNIHKQ